MDPTPQIEQDLNALTFLINASLNKPPTGYLWIPPLYAPAGAIEVFKEYPDGQQARAGEVFKVTFSFEDENGDIRVRTYGKKIYDVSSEFAQENPLWNYLRGIWSSNAIWWTRIGLPYTSSITETSYEGYLAGLDRSSLTALELAVLEGRHDPDMISTGSNGNGFNILPWALGALGFGVGGPVGAPVGFLVGQILSRTPKTAATRSEKIEELASTIPTGRGR